MQVFLVELISVAALAFFVAESLHAYTHCFGAAFGAHIQRLYDPLYFLGYLTSIHSSSITKIRNKNTCSKEISTSTSYVSPSLRERIRFKCLKKLVIIIFFYTFALWFLEEGLRPLPFLVKDKPNYFQKAGFHFYPKDPAFFAFLETKSKNHSLKNLVKQEV